MTMFDFMQAALTEWGLYALALACLAAALAAFLYVPIAGRWIAALLVVLGAVLAAYDFGYQARGSLDNSGAIQARLDEANRELDATKQIAADSNERAQIALAAHEKDQEKVNAYENRLKSDPQSGGCGLTDDDVRSLSDVGASGAPLPPRRPADLRPAGSGAKGR